MSNFDYSLFLSPITGKHRVENLPALLENEILEGVLHRNSEVPVTEKTLTLFDMRIEIEYLKEYNAFLKKVLQGSKITVNTDESGNPNPSRTSPIVGIGYLLLPDFDIFGSGLRNLTISNSPLSLKDVAQGVPLDFLPAADVTMNFFKLTNLANADSDKDAVNLETLKKAFYDAVFLGQKVRLPVVNYNPQNLVIGDMWLKEMW